MSYTIFINYRRDDASYEARLVRIALIEKFGEENVFLDVTSIAPGDKWPNEIREKLKNANAIIAVIGPKWLSAGSDEWGRRRIDQESDWVRQELEVALNGNQNIIPLFVNEAKASIPVEALPPSIKCLSEIQGIPIRRDFWDHDIRVLLARLTRDSEGDAIWPKAFDIELVTQSFFESAFPAYILDSSGCVVGWNASLGAIVGEKEGPVRGTHFSMWLMEKGHELKQSSPKRKPHDISVTRGSLTLNTNGFGQVRFDQLTTPILDKERGGVKYYVTALSPSSLEPDRTEEVMRAIESCLALKLEWTKYAVAYDRVLPEYSGYNELVELHCSAARNEKAGRVLDLGAGTGNITRAILKACPGRRVIAVDANKSSLYQLLRKCREFTRELEIRFTEIEQLDIPAETVSVVIMNNVLMFLKEPEESLRRAFDWLRDDGVISIHVSREGVCINTLLKAIMNELIDSGKFDTLQDDYEIVEELNKKFATGEVPMKRFSSKQLTELLSRVGFRVEEVKDEVYSGQGLYVRARKLRKSLAHPISAS